MEGLVMRRREMIFTIIFLLIFSLVDICFAASDRDKINSQINKLSEAIVEEKKAKLRSTIAGNIKLILKQNEKVIRAYDLSRKQYIQKISSSWENKNLVKYRVINRTVYISNNTAIVNGKLVIQKVDSSTTIKISFKLKKKNEQWYIEKEVRKLRDY